MLQLYSYFIVGSKGCLQPGNNLGRTRHWHDMRQGHDRETSMIDFNRDVIEASRRQPVLVDFYATWCGPCNMLGPVLDEVVKSTTGPLTLVKINTDESRDLAVAAGVSGIPDVRLFVDGKQVGAFTGFRPKPAVEQFIKTHSTAKQA